MIETLLKRTPSEGEQEALENQPPTIETEQATPALQDHPPTSESTKEALVLQEEVHAFELAHVVPPPQIQPLEKVVHQETPPSPVVIESIPALPSTIEHAVKQPLLIKGKGKRKSSYGYRNDNKKAKDTTLSFTPEIGEYVSAKEIDTELTDILSIIDDIGKRKIAPCKYIDFEFFCNTGLEHLQIA